MIGTDETVRPWSVETGEELRALYEFTEAIYHARSVDEVYASALEVISKTLGCERASILLFDTAGVMQFVAWRGLSERYRTRLSGHTPWKPGDQDPPPIFVEDIAETDEPDWIKQEIKAEGIVSLGFVPITVEGRVIGKFMTYYGQRRSFNRHAEALAITIARHLGFSIGRARAEAARERALSELRHSEARFRNMTDQAPIMIWMSDPTGHCEHLNKVACDFWGVDQGRIESFDWTGTIHPDDVAFVLQEMGASVSKREPAFLRARYSNTDGEWRVLQTEARPRFACDGQFLGMIGVNVDVTEQESISRQRELMFAELNHRVKNTLSVVQAIAHQTFKAEKTNPVVTTFIGRLGVLASAHDLLSKANWESTPIREIVTQVLARDPSNRRNVAAEGPAVLLSPKQALGIALALHELQTNALKYGALSVDTGQVSLKWSAPAARQLSIVWSEEGGPPVVPPKRRGFGTMMIEQALTADLNGSAQIDFRPEGLLCTISVTCEGIQT
jgi:PAS domain S-box-containing protein